MKRKESRRRIVHPLAIIALTSVVPLFAQVPAGKIGDTVMDQSKVPIQHANVTVVNRETGAQRSADWDYGVLCLVADLPPASYEGKVGAKGFTMWNDLNRGVNEVDLRRIVAD
ncbi:MAG: carboxypeptidase regulatory-like domain-containing protein [Bryobacterales bacterium]|nr:carboxypeptidase regulatory-like domain-containing protein [Bryobacterales bacterium]